MPPSWQTLFRGAVAGIIESGVAVRASTAELWAEIRGAANEAGLTIGTEGFRIVNQLRGQAAARRASYERFQRAELGTEFTPAMRAMEMNARPDLVRQMMPEYLVRFDVTYTDILGQTQTRTVSMRDVLLPDMTVGDVHSAVAAAADSMAQRENGTIYGQIVDIGNLRPVTI